MQSGRFATRPFGFSTWICDLSRLSSWLGLHSAPLARIVTFHMCIFWSLRPIWVRDFPNLRLPSFRLVFFSSLARILIYSSQLVTCLLNGKYSSIDPLSCVLVILRTRRFYCVLLLFAHFTIFTKLRKTSDPRHVPGNAEFIRCKMANLTCRLDSFHKPPLAAADTFRWKPVV